MPPRWRSAQLSSREQDGLDFGGGLRQRLGRGGTVNRRATASTWWAPARHRKQDIVVGQRLGGGGLAWPSFANRRATTGTWWGAPAWKSFVNRRATTDT